MSTSGGYHEHTGECLAHRRDIMSRSGGGRGGGHEYIGF